MRWLLAGCCGLALINISVALDDAQLVRQRPRVYAMKTSSPVTFYCLFSKQTLGNSVAWYKADEYGAKQRDKIKTGERIRAVDSVIDGAVLNIVDIRLEDRGVYYCKINNTWGPGTALHVAKPYSRSQALYRTQMKDALIILQGLLLAVCIAAIMLRKRKVFENTDSIYEEPETDHIYEGLTIETYGGGLYEELSVYAQADGAEAPWE
ncbi:B-cell antigen receptor complex-associated protein beta chain [Chelmon rostratus]|uniref:B-cell antigen receptor complex-associated protein beta chain n=1 Tax=Chelmon rostratus TaxID=109905 RepID=UPI001BE8E0B9|nr:B-cell antigen receptor complex-associated protein beta chain [Chelmon rostratus]